LLDHLADVVDWMGSISIEPSPIIGRIGLFIER
jgi:hypothetical protein